jgi:hypothetical protein
MRGLHTHLDLFRLSLFIHPLIIMRTSLISRHTSSHQAHKGCIQPSATKERKLIHVLYKNHPHDSVLHKPKRRKPLRRCLPQIQFHPKHRKRKEPEEKEGMVPRKTQPQPVVYSKAQDALHCRGTPQKKHTHTHTHTHRNTQNPKCANKEKMIRLGTKQGNRCKTIDFLSFYCTLKPSNRSQEKEKAKCTTSGGSTELGCSTILFQVGNMAWDEIDLHRSIRKIFNLHNTKKYLLRQQHWLNQRQRRVDPSLRALRTNERTNAF